MKYQEQEHKNDTLIIYNKPLSKSTNSIHPRATTLELGYLATHNHPINITMFMNH